MRNKIICFSGIDGSGKSKHARLLFKELKSIRVKCKYKWLRYPHFLTLIPLTLYEFRNLKGKPEDSHEQDEKNIKMQIKANPLIVTIWALIMFVDASLSMVRHAYLPTILGYTLILDRFVVDTLIDTALNLRKEKLIFGATGRTFLKLVPKNSLVFIFDVEESVAAFRKGSVEDINSLSRKRAMYKHLSEIYHWNIISTDKPFPEVHKTVLKLLTQIKPKPALPLRLSKAVQELS